jgi:hypothetical protein
MLTAVQPCLAFEPSFAHVIFAEFDMCSPFLFPPHPKTLVKVTEKIDEDTEFSGDC